MSSFYSGFGSGAQGSAGYDGSDLGNPLEGQGYMPRFSSDPYAQDPEPTRSADVSTLQSLHFGMDPLGATKSGGGPGDFMFGGGDFYGDSKHGNIFGSIPEAGKVDYYDSDDDDDLPLICPPKPAEPGRAPVAGAARLCSNQLFTVGTDRPPRLSKAPFFFLHCTSVEVEDADPADLGNHVQEFLAQCFDVQAVASTDSGEMAVQAEVKHQYVSCVLKFIFYEVGPRSYVIESVRQTGDAVLFVAVYRRWKEYLQVNGFKSSIYNHTS